MQPQTLTAPPQLGNPVATYTSSKSGVIFTVIFGALLVIGGIGVFILGVTPPAAGSVNDSAIVELIIGVIMFAVGAFVIYRAWHITALQVQVFTGGLVSTTRQGTIVFPWEQIVAVWQQVTKHYTNGVYSGTTHSYTIQRRDGPKANFSDALRQVEQLGNAIQQETFKYLFPQAVAAYTAGQPLYFGKLTISQQGISNGKETVAWHDVNSIRLNKGMISVSKQGKWFNWSNATVGQTPNVFIFLALVDHIKGLKH
jgi:hypothetical protein